MSDSETLVQKKKVYKVAQTTPVLVDLPWLPIRQCMKLKVLAYLYKAMHDLAPTYLSELLNQRTRHPRLWQLHDHQQLVVPPVSKSISRRGFGTIGPTHWNTLPLSLRDAPSLTFKRKLKTHLFQCAFGNV